MKRIFKWFFYLSLLSGIGFGSWWAYQTYWATPKGPSIAELHTQYLQLSDSLVENEFAMRDSAAPETIQRAQARQQWLQARISALRSQIEAHQTGQEVLPESETTGNTSSTSQTVPDALSSPAAVSSTATPVSNPTTDPSEEEMWTVIYWTVGTVVGILALIMLYLGIQIWRKRNENQSNSVDSREIDPFAAAEAKVRASGKYKLQANPAFDENEFQLPQVRPSNPSKPYRRIESPSLDTPEIPVYPPMSPSPSSPRDDSPNDSETWDWPETNTLPEPPAPKSESYHNRENLDPFELVPPPLNPRPIKPLIDAIQEIDSPIRAQSPTDQGESLRQDILKLARRGFTSSEIARRLRISQDQVEFAIRLQREKGNHG